MNFEAWAAIDTVEIDATQVSSKKIKTLSPADSYVASGDIIVEAFKARRKYSELRIC